MADDNEKFFDWVRTSLLGDSAFQIALLRLLIKKGLISEQEFLRELRRVGAHHPQEDIALSAFTEADCRSDGAFGWHPGGSEATRALAEMAGIREETKLLDVGSALGGSVRQLVEAYGCNATGLDADFIRIFEAIKRAKAMRLDDRADFLLANAFNMPFADGTFDVVWRQSAPITPFNEEKLLEECARVLKKGGVLACQQGMKTDKLTDEDTRNQPELSRRMLLDEYLFLVEKAGMKVEKVETERATRFEKDFYRALNNERYLRLYEEGKLIGCMFVARRI